MKIYILTLLGCLAIMSITGCGERVDDSMVDSQPDDLPPDSGRYYSFLERALRAALGKVPGEELTTDELATLKRLWIPYVELSYGYFGEDLDLTLLEDCINLTQLSLSGNRISDITPLKGLVNLQQLDLKHNRISDISSLKELVNLEQLDLQQNRIVDITPLQHLVQLEKVYLTDNQIANIKPLVDNPGLVNENPVHLEGGFDIRADVVSVRANPLSEISKNQHIPALEARGVIIKW